MRYLLVAVLALFLSGCFGNEPRPKEREVTYTKTKSPKFTATLDINVLDYNRTYGLISWVDTKKIREFLKSKDRFNRRVDELNAKK